MPETTIDQDKLHEFMGKVLNDFGAALSATLAYIGQKLGLYQAMAGAGWMTPTELAEKTGTHERYVREWLVNQAASGYVTYNPAAQRYQLPPEQAVALGDETSPFFVGGGFYVIKAMLRAEPRITEAFKTGSGMRWGEHDPDLFIGTERFIRPSYMAYLRSSWIPSLTDTEDKLKAGVNVADVGCGHGASTIILAKAFPQSRFYGFDSHAPSIERARDAAREAGVEALVRFEVADATSFPNHHYGLVAFFDCLHDMGDPIGAARHARETLQVNGSAMIVEPMAGNVVEENFNPVGRLFSAASTLCCVPNSLAYGGSALGTVASEEALHACLREAGFTQFRRATETPFNRIFEARP
jgi:SAM-dependent methyltransferase